MDRRLTEKQATAGELAGITALGTHETCQCRGPARPLLWTGRPGRNTGSTGHECHSGKQERAGGPRRCISCHKLGTIRFARAVPAYMPVCTRTALRRLGQARGCSITAAEARATYGEIQAVGNVKT
jgi:hypothetical protein